MFEILGPAPRAGGPLVVVAVPEEAQAFARQVPTLVTGVGKVRAATATAWACVEHRPGLLLNVGTAGSLRPGEVGAGVVHEVGTVIQHDLDGRAVESLIGTNPAPDLVLSGTGLVLATGDRFIASPRDRDALAVRAHLVDMEGYAVAAAARWLGVPVRLAKTVSDDAGHDAAVSWAEALAEASELLGVWVAAALDCTPRAVVPRSEGVS
ncbi:MAG: nucleosidase [Candidatus Nanopelagicales bacterium]